MRLRQDWRLGTVGDVAQYINGLAFKPEDWLPTGKPIIRIQNLTDPEKPFNRTDRDVEDRYIVRDGDILVSWSATLDAFLWRGAEAVLNQHIFRVIPDTALVSPKFLFYQLKHVIREMCAGEHLHGSTMRHINRGPFLSHPFWIPKASCQRDIVAAIEAHFSRLDAAEQGLKRVQAKLKHARASVLKAAVEGRLVPTEAALARAEGRRYEPASALLTRVLAERRARWAERGERGKYKEPVSPETEGLPELPEGWVWASVSQLSLSQQYGTGAKCSEDSTGVPVLRMGNIVDGRLDVSNLKYLPATHDEFPDQFLNPGELLFNRTNSPELVGKTAIYDGNPSPCACASYLIRVGFVSIIVPHYVSIVLNSLIGRSWVKRVVIQQVGQANVNGSKLSAFTVPLPPLAEQARIVAEVDRRLSVLDQVEALVGRSLTRCASLRQSILKRAFEGRLVPPSAEVTPE